MIKSISISNYKSISSLPALKLGTQLNFLIGINGAGKSTLVSALELTRRLASGRNLEESMQSIAPFGFELFTNKSGRSNSQIDLEIKTERGTHYRFTYAISLSIDGFIISDESLYELKAEKEQVLYTRNNDSFKAFDKGSKQLENVPLAVKDGQLALAAYNDPAVTEVADLISSYKVLWFDRSESESTFRIHTQDKFDTGNLDGMVAGLYHNNRAVFNKAVAVIKQIIPGFEPPQVRKVSPLDASSKDDKDKIVERYVVYWHELLSDDITYTLTGLSDGNFRIIQLIFAIFSSEKSTCLIGEELENGQHIGRVKTLVEILRTLSIKLNVQLIFTTHSRELLDYVSPPEVIYCSRDTNGYSVYENLSEKIDTSLVKSELGREPTARDLLDLGIV